MASTVYLPLQGKNPVCQATIDKTMMDLDGTDDKSRLGANAILAVSIAVCRVCPLSLAQKNSWTLVVHKLHCHITRTLSDVRHDSMSYMFDTIV